MMVIRLLASMQDLHMQEKLFKAKQYCLLMILVIRYFAIHSFQNRTLLLDEENLRVRKLAHTRVPRHVAGSVVRHTDLTHPLAHGPVAVSAPPPDISHGEARGVYSYYPALKEDDSNQEISKGDDSKPSQPRRRPQLLRSPEIPAPLASMESVGSRLSGASEGFDIGPDMVYKDQDDQETVV